MKNFTRKEIDKYGDVYYINEFGDIHRTDGPAIEFNYGENWWYIHGKCHRIEGPAVEHSDGSKSWYVNKIRLCELQINKLQKLRETINDDDLLNELLLSGQLVL